LSTFRKHQAIREPTEPIINGTKEPEDKEEHLEMSRSCQSLDITEFVSEDNDLDFVSSDSMSEEEEDEHLDDSQKQDQTYTNPLFSFDNNVNNLNVLGPKIIVRFGNEANLSNATDVKLIGNGKCLVTDFIQSRIVQFDKHGKHNINYHIDDMIEPWAVDINKSGMISVTSRRSHCIFQFRRNGEIGTPFGASHFASPTGIASDKNGRIIICDSILNIVCVHDSDGNILFHLGDPVSPIQEFSCPRYVTVSPMDEILVSDSGSHCVKVFDSKGKFIKKIGRLGRRDGELKYPYGVCTDRQGNILVADHYNDRVCFFSRSGEFIRHLVTAHDGLRLPQGIFLTPDYKLYVTHGGLKAKEVIVYDLKQNSS